MHSLPNDSLSNDTLAVDIPPVARRWMHSLPNDSLSTETLAVDVPPVPADILSAVALLCLFADNVLQVKCTDGPLKFKMRGFVTNANFNTKKANFLLFINNRLVHCTSLKKALDGLYASVLPKHTSFFAYMALDLSPENVDVNVHPTKSEVGLTYYLYSGYFFYLFSHTFSPSLLPPLFFSSLSHSRSHSRSHPYHRLSWSAY